ncbi:MAG: fatty acid desaturase [Planctomycetes bacterium]|nr:fatty acid desaturase [Planctomycetota bacterium]
MISTKKPLQIIPHKEYVRVIRPLLPPEAFKRSPGKVWGIVFYSVLFVLGVIAVGQIDSIWIRALLSLGLGHCVASLAFFGHDLSHGSIVRTPWIRYPLEVWVWAIRFMPSTMWRRLHNETHHVFSNTQRDCDRQLLNSELNVPVRLLSRFVTPFQNYVRWSPLVGLAFVSYTFAHMALAFTSGFRGGPPTPYNTWFGIGRLTRMALELVVCAAIQVGILALVGWDFWAYIWCGPIPIAISSAVTMGYIFTNHFLNEITEEADPVQGTTTVTVPRIVDWLHLHFSYHTEHHLFPSLNSAYYPLVAQILMREFPDRYNRIPFSTAWRRLWSVPLGAEMTPSTRLVVHSDRLKTDQPSKAQVSMVTSDTGDECEGQLVDATPKIC